MGTCPECDADIEVADDDLEEMEAGDPWDCDACGSRLRVSSVDPLEFDIDDDDDDDEDEEEEEAGGEGSDDAEDADLDDDAEDDEEGGDDWED